MSMPGGPLENAANFYLGILFRGFKKVATGAGKKKCDRRGAPQRRGGYSTAFCRGKKIFYHPGGVGNLKNRPRDHLDIPAPEIH